MRGIRRHLTGPAPSSWQHLQYAIDVFPAPAPAANKWDTIVISCTGFFASISFIDSRGLGSVVMPLLDQLNVIAVQLGPMLESMDDIEGPRQFLEVRRMARPESPAPIPFNLTGDLVIDGRTEPLGESEETLIRDFTFI
jgi:hypothetical protein